MSINPHRDGILQWANDDQGPGNLISPFPLHLNQPGPMEESDLQLPKLGIWADDDASTITKSESDASTIRSHTTQTTSIYDNLLRKSREIATELEARSMEPIRPIPNIFQKETNQDEFHMALSSSLPYRAP